MKVGDLVVYRDRIISDPQPPGCWGEVGIVLKIKEEMFKKSCPEPAVLVLDQHGDMVVIRIEDLKIIGNQALSEEALWKMWGDR